MTTEPLNVDANIVEEATANYIIETHGSLGIDTVAYHLLKIGLNLRLIRSLLHQGPHLQKPQLRSVIWQRASP